MLLVALMLAQTVPQCPATDVNLPAPLAAWTAPGDGLSPGKAMWLRAGDPAKLAWPVANPKPGKASVIAFRVDTPGTYGVALDQGGWIDLYPIKGKTPLKSVRHGHGPECSSIRKIVWFDLKPATYRLTVTGLQADTVKAMLVRE